MEDLYQVLGVTKSATADEIKKAYRTLAFKYHPDRNPGDKAAEDMFKKISAAYDVLGDETKRRQYDSYGSSGYNTQQGYGNAGYGNTGYGQQQYDPFGAWTSSRSWSSNGSAHDPFAEWSGFNTSRNEYWYTQADETRAQRFMSFLRYGGIFLAGLFFMRFWWLFFPITPILCLSAIVTGFTGMVTSFKRLFSRSAR